MHQNALLIGFCFVIFSACVEAYLIRRPPKDPTDFSTIELLYPNDKRAYLFPFKAFLAAANGDDDDESDYSNEPNNAELEAENALPYDIATVAERGKRTLPFYHTWLMRIQNQMQQLRRQKFLRSLRKYFN